MRLRYLNPLLLWTLHAYPRPAGYWEVMLVVPVLWALQGVDIRSSTAFRYLSFEFFLTHTNNPFLLSLAAPLLYHRPLFTTGISALCVSLTDLPAC